jgi:hypothetical protein
MKITIPIDIYECKVIFQTVNTYTEVCTQINKLAKKHKVTLPNNVGDAAEGQVLPAFKIYYIILSDTAQDKINLLLHELLHCVLSICEDRGIEDEESKAWLQGYIGSKIFKKYIV